MVLLAILVALVSHCPGEGGERRRRFVLCGLGIGFVETAESTVAAQLLPEHLRGNGFGVLGLVQPFGDIRATMVIGILWSVFSATVSFLYAATWMILSVAASGWLRPRRQRPGDPTP